MISDLVPDKWRALWDTWWPAIGLAFAAGAVALHWIVIAERVLSPWWLAAFWAAVTADLAFGLKRAHGKAQDEEG